MKLLIIFGTLVSLFLVAESLTKVKRPLGMAPFVHNRWNQQEKIFLRFTQTNLKHLKSILFFLKGMKRRYQDQITNQIIQDYVLRTL